MSFQTGAILFADSLSERKSNQMIATLNVMTDNNNTSCHLNILIKAKTMRSEESKLVSVFIFFVM